MDKVVIVLNLMDVPGLNSKTHDSQLAILVVSQTIFEQKPKYEQNTRLWSSNMDCKYVTNYSTMS